MGMWVTSGNIARLIAKLDWKFGDVGLAKVRSVAARKNRFNGSLPLHKIARLFRIWPGGANGSGNQAARFWYGFLRWLHTQPNAAGTGSTVADDIVSIIRDAINDPHCRAMNFMAIEGNDVRVTPVSIPAPTTADISAYIQMVLLQTLEHGTDDEPEPPSFGQDPPGEDIPDPVATPLKGGAAKKKAAKKKAAKKKRT